MYIIPSNTPHRAASVDGPAVVLDVFSPIREDYAERFNKYIHSATRDGETGSAAPTGSSKGE
jgi:hypothetical protein